jgi:hypothetical protein
MPSPRVYIEPGTEVDCAYEASTRGSVRGFLRLPDRSNPGRARFIRDVRTEVLSDDEQADSVALDLFGRATATPACLVDCHLGSHRFSIPFPPPYPLELIANAVIVGAHDAHRQYAQATVRSEGLLDFFGTNDLTLPDVAGGATSLKRAEIDGDGWSIVVTEAATVETEPTSASLRWYGELTMEGEARSLDEWAGTLAELLLLFSFLCDRPLVPERIYTVEEAKPVDYYASWPETSAPILTEPLATLRRIESRLDEIVHNWRRLRDGAPDLVAHVAEYQLHRNRHTLPGRAVDLCRCPELYHAYSKRFRSVVRSKTDHAALVAALLADVTDDLRAEHGAWIRKALKEANRKRLVDQINDILDDLGQDVLEWCYVADADEFAAVAKAMRNHYTHPTGKQPARVPDEGRDLLILINRLWFVIRACLLVELVLPQRGRGHPQAGRPAPLPAQVARGSAGGASSSRGQQKTRARRGRHHRQGTD